MKWYDLIIFDVDGTLVINFDSTELLPGVSEYFQRRDPDTAVAFASNQGGVGLRYWMERDQFGNPADYPTEAQAWARLYAIRNELCPHAPILAAFAYQSKKTGLWGPVPEGSGVGWAPHWRKPGAGMLEAAMRNYGVGAKFTLMVGDREEDRIAAEAAGVDFAWADAFFGRNT